MFYFLQWFFEIEICNTKSGGGGGGLDTNGNKQIIYKEERNKKEALHLMINEVVLEYTVNSTIKDIKNRINK